MPVTGASSARPRSTLWIVSVTLERFLDEQQDLSPKARPRYVRLVGDLPRTATHKVLHRELSAAGIAGIAWTREERGTRYL